MKAVLIIILSVITLGFYVIVGINKEQKVDVISYPIDTNYFKTHLQPVLKKHCSPCHFSGGKMYEKMPFDKAETIINHEAGILKRIKSESDLAILKQFLKQSKFQTETNIDSSAAVNNL